MNSLHLAAVPESLDAITAFVTSAAESAGLGAPTAYKLQLAVDEIATNIIVHGHQEAGRSGELTVRADLTDDALAIVLEDRAEPFDPRANASPVNLDAAPEDREIGGLGVFLALRSVDRFEYAYVDGCNRNTFVMNRPRPEGSTE